MRLLKVGLRRQVCATTRETPVNRACQATDQTRTHQGRLTTLCRLKPSLNLNDERGGQPDQANANAGDVLGGLRKKPSGSPESRRTLTEKMQREGFSSSGQVMVASVVLIKNKLD